MRAARRRIRAGDDAAERSIRALARRLLVLGPGPHMTTMLAAMPRLVRELDPAELALIEARLARMLTAVLRADDLRSRALVRRMCAELGCAICAERPS